MHMKSRRLPQADTLYTIEIFRKITITIKKREVTYSHLNPKYTHTMSFFIRAKGVSVSGLKGGLIMCPAACLQH